jgi:hypothetical protein
MRPSPLIGRAVGNFQYGLDAPILFIPNIAYMKQEITGAGATTPASIGSVVGSWQNLGTIGGWATAATDAIRPALKQSGGFNYLEANVTTDNQITLSTAQSGAFEGVDFCMTFAALVSTKPVAIFGSGGTSSATNSIGANVSGNMRVYLNGTNINGGTTPATNTVYVQNCYAQGTTVELRTNGGLSTYSASSSTRFATATPMSIFSGDTAVNVSRFYALIIRTGTVSAAVRLADEQYIGSLCGVTI